MVFPPKRKAAHHRGTFHVASARCRAAAYADSSTRCRRCGLTLEQVRAGTPARPPKPKAIWTAGHLVDGQVNGLLAPECSPCANSSGARLANRRAKANRLRTEWTW